MIEEETDTELESRVRAAFDEMIPKLLDRSASPEMVDGFDDVRNEVAVRRVHIEHRSPRTLVAAGLLVAATIIGLIVVAQRDTSNVVPADPNTATADNTTLANGTASAEPGWYRLLRPYIPQRFQFAAMTGRSPDQIRVVAIDPRDGKALEIFVARAVDYANLQSNAPTDDVGKWNELVGLGWNVTRPDGLSVELTCEIGLPARGHGGRNYCEVEGVAPFTMDEIRVAVAMMVTSIDASILDADLGLPVDDVAFDLDAFTEQVNGAVQDPNLMALRDMPIGHGDRVFEFGTEEVQPSTAVRVLRGLYPLPPTTGQAAYALYDDAAAFWMLRADGVAVRLTTTDTSIELLSRLEVAGHYLLDGSILDPAPGFAMPEIGLAIPQTTTVVPTTTTLVEAIMANPTTTLLRTPTGPHLLPTLMPPGFDDVADGYTTETEGAETGAASTRAFVGTGDQPAVVMMFSTPADEVGEDIDLGLRDMTTYSARPSFGFGVVRPSGRYDWLRSGGVNADDLQLLAENVGDQLSAGSSLATSTDMFTEVTWTHTPQNAHGITWNGPEEQTISMFAESGHGIDAVTNGITWSIDAVDTPVGQVFISVDATDATFVQVGLVVDGQVINIEAQNVAVSEVVSMVASIQLADDSDWVRRVVN